MPVSDDAGAAWRMGSVAPPSGEAEMVRAAVRAVRSGNQEAFGRLVLLFQTRLFGFLMIVTRSRPGAEEVTQEAFLRALRNLHLYDVRRPFYPWLATIGFRLAQNWIKRRARLGAREGAELEPGSHPSTITNPLEEILKDEKSRRLWRSVEALPAGERTAVILYYRQELRVSEVAKVLGVTSGTVKTLLFRGRRHLKDALEISSATPGEDYVDV